MVLNLFFFMFFRTVRSKIVVRIRNLIIFGDFQNNFRPKIQNFWTHCIFEIWNSCKLFCASFKPKKLPKKFTRHQVVPGTCSPRLPRNVPLPKSRSPHARNRLIAGPPMAQEDFSYNQCDYNRVLYKQQELNDYDFYPHQNRYQPYKEWRYPDQMLPGVQNAFYV